MFGNILPERIINFFNNAEEEAIPVGGKGYTPIDESFDASKYYGGDVDRKPTVVKANTPSRKAEARSQEFDIAEIQKGVNELRTLFFS